MPPRPRFSRRRRQRDDEREPREMLADAIRRQALTQLRRQYAEGFEAGMVAAYESILRIGETGEMAIREGLELYQGDPDPELRTWIEERLAARPSTEKLHAWIDAYQREERGR